MSLFSSEFKTTSVYFISLSTINCLIMFHFQLVIYSYVLICKYLKMYKTLEDGTKITRFPTKKNKCEDSLLKVRSNNVKVK